MNTIKTTLAAAMFAATLNDTQALYGGAKMAGLTG